MTQPLAPFVAEQIRALEGYGTTGSLQVLAGVAGRVPERGYIVELGCYKGQGTVALGLGSKRNVTLVTVDHFKGEAASSAGTMHFDHIVGDYRDDFEKNLDHFDLRKKVVVLTGDTVQRGREWAGPPIDLLVVDGDHRAPAPLSDFRAWEPHLTDEAIVVFDDTTFPGVASAILTIESEGEWRVFERHSANRISILRRAKHGKA